MVHYQNIETPLGPMLAAASDVGLCLLEFAEPERLARQLKRLEAMLDEAPVDADHPLFARLEQQLAAYFAGELKAFDLPLDLLGSDFQRQAWTALTEIPYGETRSYQQQAEAIGRPASVRAVARANGDNRIGILVPCHRVIGKDGSLTGYGGGLWRKQKLLALEGALSQAELF